MRRPFAVAASRRDRVRSHLHMRLSRPRFSSSPLRLVTLIVVASGWPAAAAAQSEPDTAYERQIVEHTSDPRFLPESTASLPRHSIIPTPLEHFGTIIGAPGVMHRTAEVHGYYHALAETTPRLRVETLGRSEEGRDIVVVVIADERTMSRLDHYRAQLARLADPRALPADQVDAVIDDAKPVYYLQAGLHSPEMGSPEVMMELAYRLVASDEPVIRNIRENVITLINPVAEPDGRDRQVDWYHRYTKARTEWDDGFPRSAPYWGRYVYHDNNRDGLQVSQALTRAIFDTYFAWHPTVMLDLHESVPLLYISTGTGPYNETIDPITIGEWQVLANHDLTSLTAQGLPGVFTWAFYDGWWPGYAIWVANNHNTIGRFYETFGNAGANTFVRDLSSSSYAGDDVTERLWYRPDPATSKVRWSARDNVNYMQAGVIASLTYAADNGGLLLRNFYRKGANSIERGRTQKPHAFVIPSEQRDPKRAAYLVNQLQRQGIEVHQRASGDSAGDYVVLLDQPYRNHAVSLLTEQDFPSDAPHPPYDDIAWTLGYLYGVDVYAVDDTSVFGWPGLDLMPDTAAYIASVAGAGPVYALEYRAQAELLPALYWLRERAPRARAWAAEQAFTPEPMAATTSPDSDNGDGDQRSRSRAGFEGDHPSPPGRGDGGEGVGNSDEADELPAGSVVFEGINASLANEIAERFALDLVSLPTPPQVDRHELDLPRVAVYHTWYSTQDEGWVRYTLEQASIPYTSIDKNDLRAGNLLGRFDVILVPSVRGAVEQLIQGIDRKWSPMPYSTTEEFPSHGTPDATDDMTGGPGFEGMAELQAFVENGGVLVTLANATALAAETGITRVLSPHPANGLFHPGSVVRAKARRPDHPILYGFPEQLHVFRGNGSLYRTAKRDRGAIVLQYGTKPLEDEEEKDEGPMLGIPAAPEDSAEAADTITAAEEARDTPAARAAADKTAARDTENRPAAEDTEEADDSEDDDDNESERSGYVLSGMVRNEKEIVGHGAIFDVPVGRGRVVAFTFNPLHRFLNHHEFPLVWNTLLNWNDLE